MSAGGLETKFLPSSLETSAFRALVGIDAGSALPTVSEEELASREGASSRLSCAAVDANGDALGSAGLTTATGDWIWVSGTITSTSTGAGDSEIAFVASGGSAEETMIGGEVTVEGTSSLSGLATCGNGAPEMTASFASFPGDAGSAGGEGEEGRMAGVD